MSMFYLYSTLFSPITFHIKQIIQTGYSTICNAEMIQFEPAFRDEFIRSGCGYQQSAGY